MTCPHCATRLVCTVRMDIVVETCPVCEGVWLDKGEIQVLLNLAAGRETQSDLLESIFLPNKHRRTNG